MKRFSVQQVIDCSFRKYNFNGLVGNDGCSGGLEYHALVYIQQYGLQYESDYPYVGTVQKCKYEPTKAVTNITGIYTASSIIGDIEAMKKVVERQPIIVYMHATDSFYKYKDGNLLNINLVKKI